MKAFHGRGGILLVVILSAALQGFYYVFNKLALMEVTAVQSIFFNSVFIALFASIFMGKSFFRWRPIEISRLLPISVINAIGSILFYFSLSYLHPLTSGLLGRFFVVFTTFFSVMALKEKMHAKEWLLTILALLSSFALVYRPGAEAHLGMASLLAIGATFFFALSVTLIKAFLPDTQPSRIYFSHNAVALPLLGLYVLFVPQEIGHFPSLKSLSLILVAAFCFFSLSLDLYL